MNVRYIFFSIMNSCVDNIFSSKKSELLEIYENKMKNKKMTMDKDKLDYSVNKIITQINTSPKKVQNEKGYKKILH
jgi:hypothetical protein